MYHTNTVKYLCAHLSLHISLPPDDPAAWAGLMAACHTENTSCYLSGSAPCRQGLEKILMAIVSEKGMFVGVSIWSLRFVCLSDIDLFVFLSAKRRGDRAPSSPGVRRLGAATGSDWSCAGWRAGAGRSPLHTGLIWTHTLSTLFKACFLSFSDVYHYVLCFVPGAERFPRAPRGDAVAQTGAVSAPPSG